MFLLQLLKSLKPTLDLPKPNQVRECLASARILIEAGWCQHTFHKDGDYCPIGAIFESAPTYTVATLARAQFKVANSIRMEGIECWNDKWYRFKFQVLRAFDRAIANIDNYEPIQEGTG